MRSARLRAWGCVARSTQKERGFCIWGKGAGNSEYCFRGACRSCGKMRAEIPLRWRTSMRANYLPRRLRYPESRFLFRSRRQRIQAWRGFRQSGFWRGRNRLSARTCFGSLPEKTYFSTNGSGIYPAAASRRKCVRICQPFGNLRGKIPFACRLTDRGWQIIWDATAVRFPPSFPS